MLKIKNKQNGKVVAILKDDATEPEILEDKSCKKKKKKVKKTEETEEIQEEEN